MTVCGPSVAPRARPEERSIRGAPGPSAEGFEIDREEGFRAGSGAPLDPLALLDELDTSPDIESAWEAFSRRLARDGGKAFDAAMAEHGAALRLAAFYFHRALAARELADDHVSDCVLSPRERECLLRLAQGMRAAQVADALGLSDRTVEHYLASARRKLEAATSTEAVAKAILLRIIHP